VDLIIDAGDVISDDTVLEIGPGKGMLTKKLLRIAEKVVAVEKDDDLFELLKESFKKEIKMNKLDLIHGDILEFDASRFEVLDYKLIANIPYNITGQIIRQFLSSSFQPKQMVLMVQKEVAERIVAKNQKESVLSLSVKAYGEPVYIKTVKAGSFFPVPSVDSAVLSVQNISKNFFAEFNEEKFFDILHAGFKSKRKKLSSNLSTLVNKEKIKSVFEKLEIDDNTRAEDVPMGMWKKIVAGI